MGATGTAKVFTGTAKVARSGEFFFCNSYHGQTLVVQKLTESRFGIPKFGIPIKSRFAHVCGDRLYHNFYCSNGAGMTMNNINGKLIITTGPDHGGDGRS